MPCVALALPDQPQGYLPTPAAGRLALDQVIDDPLAYRRRFIDLAGQLGFQLHVSYEWDQLTRRYGRHLGAGGEPTADARDRSNRLAALTDHMDRHGFRRFIMAGVEAGGATIDGRVGRPRALAQALRDRLVYVGPVYIENDRLCMSVGMPRDWDRDDATAARTEDAHWSFHTALKLHGARAHVMHVVRKLGTKLANGIVVLEARS